MIRNTKIGDVIRMYKHRAEQIANPKHEIEAGLKKTDYMVTGVYPFFVECVTVKPPYSKTSFCLGDLVIAGVEDGSVYAQ